MQQRKKWCPLEKRRHLLSAYKELDMCLKVNFLQEMQFAGEQMVPELISTEASIGAMETICEFCNARKWGKETASICCNGGKVSLDVFPPPPKLIQDLLIGDSVEARLFRENTRSFNNGLALSSVVVQERKFSNGYNPSVIFEGKVSQMYGPLL